MPAPTIRIRPLTVVLVLCALVLVAVGVVYFTTPAHNLPSFFPGHEDHGTRHHVKHGIAMIGLAVVVLIGAWFTTAPERSGS
jgi:amino acid permease